MNDAFPDVETITVTKTKPKLPSMYKVVLHNDDFTSMDFVIKILMTIFDKSPEQAYMLTLHVHEKGKGIAGIYIKEIAESKKKETMLNAKQNGFPLRVTIEEDA